MSVRDLSDGDLISDLEFAVSVMHTDSHIDDILIEYADGTKVTYRELLDEAARRAEKA